MSINSKMVTCGQCVLKTPDGKACRWFGAPIISLDKGCPYGSTTYTECNICGKQIVFEMAHIFISDSDSVKLLCEECSTKLNTCAVCSHKVGCAFNESSDPTPKAVTKQIPINGGYAVTQVMNPERIRNTCKKGCPCFSGDFGCSRQNNWCEHQDLKI